MQGGVQLKMQNITPIWTHNKMHALLFLILKMCILLLPETSQKGRLPLLSLRLQRWDKFMGARASCPSARAGLDRSLIPRTPDAETETETVTQSFWSRRLTLFSTPLSPRPHFPAQAFVSCTLERRLEKEVVDVIETSR